MKVVVIVATFGRKEQVARLLSHVARGWVEPEYILKI